ncbi:MAG: hypothetical protein ACRCU6_08240 [Fusobacteriaceae bacterium]
MKVSKKIKLRRKRISFKKGVLKLSGLKNRHIKRVGTCIKGKHLFGDIHKILELEKIDIMYVINNGKRYDLYKFLKVLD